MPATLQRVANLAVPTVADWCVVDIVERDGRVNRVAAAHADPSRAASSPSFQRASCRRPDWPATRWPMSCAVVSP